ncbi:permease-like cell division protein FtsX [Jeotgalibacillus haloalkalitolerans]|uniref:Cell division protein FtsX n=1 Tax=Jeotgalibacillus haloalkalitolerans TaxID=3104292 RepID=A0ABU5KJS8_9BACL|nr:permease-like cell division protein FtsX [Jeotgalibacillus sp. HH7-29]MDZ5711503.1 permease-like cell division protein FtsX [Jeotgalibacillus sp. HH7-29]
MKARTLTRHFRESFKSLARNGWMTFASVSAVTVTLLLVGVFTALMLNMNKAADDIENDVEMNVYVELEADEQAVASLEQEIEQLSGVESIDYSTKEEELSGLIDSFGEEMALFEQNNPLRDKFVVKAIDPRQTERLASQIGTLENTHSVEYGEGKIDRLFSILEVSRNVGAVLIFGLLFTAMFLISNTIKITIVARRTEIEIMKLVGASNWFVRIPFILEGIWLGIIGSILPIAAVSFLYYNVYEYMEPRLEDSFIQILEFSPFIYQINALILLMGVVIGVWGSFMSVRKFLRV